MAHDSETRDQLRRRYVHDRMGLEQAAEACGISYPTARRWKTAAETAGDDWERARSVVSLTQDGQNSMGQLLLADFLTLLSATQTELREAKDVPVLAKVEAMSRLSDALHKTLAAMAKTSPSLSRLAIAMDTVALLIRFVEANHHEAIGLLAEILGPFGDFLSKEFSA